MMREKWENIKAIVESKFKITEISSDHIEKEGGIDIEHVVFEGPLGLMKLEYITKPVIVDKKVTYSNRIGSESSVEYVYSKDEKSSKMKAYKWNDDNEEWMEIDAKSFS